MIRSVRATDQGSGKLRDVAPDPCDHEIVGLLFQVIGLMKHHVIASTADLGLTPQQAHALRCLDPGQPLPMRDLAGQLMCDASTVTGLVDRLEERALVERRPDPGDRRVKALVLTDAGIAARQRLIEVLTTGAPHRSSLDAAQRAQLRDLLRQIVDRGATSRGRVR
jgi:DNA-binding MarR family transcriptional regulator